MSDERGIRVSEADGLARVSIHLPPVNVLSVAYLNELGWAVESSRAARVIVLSGLPRAFSAGVEIAEHAPEPETIEKMLQAMRRVLTALIESPALKFESFHATDIKVRTFQETAIATCLWSARSLVKGQYVGIQFRTMHVYINTPLGWRVVSGQTTNLLPDLQQAL